MGEQLWKENRRNWEKTRERKRRKDEEDDVKKKKSKKKTKTKKKKKKEKEEYKAGYTAQDAPSMRIFHLRK